MATIYDNYQLQNSSKVREFQGSTLPELMKVSDILQQRYDAAELGIEGGNTMIRNAKALSRDKELLNARSAYYQEQLDALSKRPDLENVVKDVAHLGRGFADEYKNFANNMAAAQKYQEELDKWTQKDKGGDKTIANALMQMSLDQYGGLKRDEKTGKYAGSFAGIQPADVTDTAEWVKKVVGDVASSKDAWVEETDTGLYFVKRNGTREKVDYKTDILPRMKEAFRLDPKIQSDFAQRQAIAAWRGSKTKLSDLADTPQNATSKAEAQALIEKGVPEAEAMAMVFGNQTYDQAVNDLFSLGQKYAFEKETVDMSRSHTFAYERAKKQLEDEVAPLTATILQPVNLLSSSAPADLDKAIVDKAKANKGINEQMSYWIKENGVKNNGGGRMVDKEGNDVTFIYQRYKDQAEQARRAYFSIQDLKKRAKERAGFTSVPPELEAKAKAAYQERYDQIASETQWGMEPPEHVKRQAEQEAQFVYDHIIQDSPGYKRYKEVLANLAKGEAMNIGITTFGSKAANEQALNNFKNLALNLDSDGLEFGAIGLEWGSGDNAGQKLEADDYAKIKEEATFAGVGIDVDGKYKFFYKVGNVEGVAKKGGEKGAVLVKMPAMGGTSEVLIKNGQITEAEQILTQEISDILSTSNGSGSIKFPRGEVRVSRVDAASARTPDGVEMILEYQGSDGKWHKTAPQSRGEAVSSLINTLRKH